MCLSFKMQSFINYKIQKVQQDKNDIADKSKFYVSPVVVTRQLVIYLTRIVIILYSTYEAVRKLEIFTCLMSALLLFCC